MKKNYIGNVDYVPDTTLGIEETEVNEPCSLPLRNSLCGGGRGGIFTVD